MAAPQLRLDVSLNLSGFRGEIQKLTNIAQSEFVPKINIKFNRRTLDTELNNLQAAIKRRVYRVEIGGNIDKLPDKIRGLKEQLSSLESFKIDLGIGAVKSLSKKDAKDIANGLRAQILGEQTKLYMPVSIKPSVTREDVRNFKNTVKSKLTGLSVDVKANVQGAGFAGTKSGAAGLMEYMQKEGLLGKTASGMTMQMGKDSGEIKRQLNEAVQSAEKIKSVFDGVAKNIATTGKSIANIQGKRIGLQNVPLMAGSVEKRVERSASAIGSTTSFDTLKALYPEISKTIVSFAALRGQIQQNASKLSGFSLIIGLAAFAGVPLAKSIVKLTGSADSFTKLLDKLGPKLEIAFAKAASNILNTASSRLLSGGSVAGLLPAAYRGIGPSAGPAGLLPPAYRGIEPSRSAGALPPAYRGLPFGFDFKGLPPGGSGGDKGGSLGPTIQQMREQLFSSVRIAEARVREIFDIVADFDSRQKAAGQARLDKAVQDFVKGLEDITRRAILRGGVRQVNVADLGGAVRPALPSGRSPLMLPPAGGTTATGRIRVSTGAYLGQPGFMQAPSVPSPAGGGGTPPLPPRGGGGGGAFGGMQFNMPQLPGAGLVREIGEEFGFAAKQVLLFGTAYKALAFLQSFPGQVGDAVGALQSFRNTIKEISPSAQEAADSSQFILDIVDKYNTPLQSARDGFVKLYASMQPAGFSGDEIRDLFLGISQTAATFGMSADKVDRVNYAFAQMASKGQVMSEELKGQLGDVLPGAMAIFAEAAGFKGPEAITKFSKALEDGAYKGGAMKVLLTNVGSIMRKEFGPGAEGAARTFQGVMNRMQNSLKLLYETFEPVAVGFLNSVVMPMTSGLKTVTDGLNAFFTGAATKTAGGFAIAQELEKLRPTFDGLRTNASQLIPVLGQIAQVALGVGKAFLQIASNPFVGYVARVYLNILVLTTAINILNLRALIPMIANFARSLYALIAFAIQCVSTGSVVQRLGMAVQVTGLMLRTFFATTGIGLVLVGIGLLTERFISMNQALADTKAKAAGAADAIRAMSQTEARQASQQYDRQAQSLKGLSREIEEGKMKGKAWIEVTKEQAEALKSAGVTVSDVRGSLQVQPMRVGGAYQKVEGLAAEARYRVRVLDYQDKQSKQQASIAPIPPGTGDGTDAQRAADKAASQQQQAAIDAANRQNALDKSRFEGLTALSEQAYQHEINLIDLVNEYRLNGLNSIEARQEKFQQDLQKIELKRIETVRKAQEQMQKAQIDYTAAQRTAGAAGAGSGNQAGGGAVFGDTGRTFNAKGWVHGHFQNMNKSALIEDTVDVVMKLLEQGVKPEISSGAAFGAGMGREQVTSLVRRGIESHKRYASGASAIDVSVPQGTPVPVPLSGVGDLGGAAGVTGSLARSTQLMHLDPKSKSGAARTMERRSAKAGGTAGVEQQDLLYKGMESGLSIINATTIALKERENLIAANINTIFPVAEQRLENDLMKMRNQLQLQGMPQEYIAFQEQQYKTTYEAAEAIKRKKQETMEYSKTVEALQAKQAQGKTLTSDEAEDLRFYTEAIRQNDQALTDLIEKQKAYNIAALESAIASIKNADALKAQQDAIQLIDSNVESATGSYKNFIKEVAQGGDPAEALKKFQESITDQVLTVFLDYAFQPVEEFLKDSLKNMFGLPTEEKQRQETLTKLQEQLDQQKAILVQAEKIATNTTPGAAAGTTQSPVAGSAFAPGGTLPTAAAGFDAASVFGNPEALTSAFAGIQSSISTSMEGITSSFQMGADSLANTLPSWSDALTTKLPAALTTSTNNTEGEIPAFQESLGKVASGIGIAAGAIMGIAAGISQIKKGGTGNTLMGIGSIMASVGGAIGGFTKLFAGANGGVAGGGWKPFPVSAFANGGMVKGPTLGLVGEGKYNEAIVPLPDGRSIPVQMRGGGGSGSRDLLANQAQSRPSPSVLSMSFQSTTINGVEYVDRAQLEAAMEETRRAASREGANKGASLAIDRLANSPSSRRRAGIR
jgi:tape measure domain-containing protein